MSGVDVKSLFKSGKKSIKAFKIAAGPVSTTEKAAEESIESWETSQATTVVPVVNVALEEFKQEQQEEGTKTAVSWSQIEESSEPATVAPTKPTSAYVPPSQRRAEAAVAMPSLSELSRASSSATGPARAASGTASVAPPRLKLITASTKKAMEDEAKRKEEEKQKKEAEKLARKEQLKAELAQQTLEADRKVQASASGSEIKAAPLDQIYAKYIDRPKVGRKLSSKAA